MQKTRVRRMQDTVKTEKPGLGEENRTWRKEARRRGEGQVMPTNQTSQHSLLCVRLNLYDRGWASAAVKVVVEGPRKRGSRGQRMGPRPSTHMERMGATSSREAMRMPISQMQAVSSSAQVGSPLALPWPKTWEQSSHRGRLKPSVLGIRGTEAGPV